MYASWLQLQTALVRSGNKIWSYVTCKISKNVEIRLILFAYSCIFYSMCFTFFEFEKNFEKVLDSDTKLDTII